MHIYIYIYYVCMYTYTYTHTHTYIHIHIHTYILIDTPFSAFSFGLVSITCTQDFKTTIIIVKIILKPDESIAYSFLSTFASCSARRCFRKASRCSLLSLNSAISSGVFFTRKSIHLFKNKNFIGVDL